MVLPQFADRMTDAEGLMWRADVDPFLSSTFASVTVLDRPPDVDRLMRRIERAVNLLPRLHQRVQPAPANLRAPSWVTDANFELRYHVRHTALPAPGTMRQLLDLASLIAADPFDRARPLWQFTIVEGLSGGRAALIQKMHHAISDGETALRMSMEFLDLQRDAPEPAAVEPFDVTADGAHEPHAAETLRDLVAGSVRTPLGLMRQLNQLVVDPGRLPAAGGALRSVIEQLGVNDKARSPLWTARSLRRHVEVLTAPFAETKQAAKQLGGTLNDAFLTAAADAAGRYHTKLGAPVDELRASMAVSTRTAESGTNAFSIARISVPTGPMPIAERFRAIVEASRASRGGGAPSLDSLAPVVGTLPTSVITRLARQATQAIDFATSNVRGAAVPMYIAGSRIQANYPIGPLLGVSFNLTLVSLPGSLDMGVNIDPAAVTEPELLRECLEASFADLIAAKQAPRRARSTRAKRR